MVNVPGCTHTNPGIDGGPLLPVLLADESLFPPPEEILPLLELPPGPCASSSPHAANKAHTKRMAHIVRTIFFMPFPFFDIKAAFAARRNVAN
jgi:hypothetical protein